MAMASPSRPKSAPGARGQGKGRLFSLGKGEMSSCTHGLCVTDGSVESSYGACRLGEALPRDPWGAILNVSVPIPPLCTLDLAHTQPEP